MDDLVTHVDVLQWLSKIIGAAKAYYSLEVVNFFSLHTYLVVHDRSLNFKAAVFNLLNYFFGNLFVNPFLYFNFFAYHIARCILLFTKVKGVRIKVLLYHTTNDRILNGFKA